MPTISLVWASTSPRPKSLLRLRGRPTERRGSGTSGCGRSWPIGLAMCRRWRGRGVQGRREQRLDLRGPGCILSGRTSCRRNPAGCAAVSACISLAWSRLDRRGRPSPDRPAWVRSWRGRSVRAALRRVGLARALAIGCSGQGGWSGAVLAAARGRSASEACGGLVVVQPRAPRAARCWQG